MVVLYHDGPTHAYGYCIDASLMASGISNIQYSHRLLFYLQGMSNTYNIRV